MKTVAFGFIFSLAILAGSMSTPASTQASTPESLRPRLVPPVRVPVRLPVVTAALEPNNYFRGHLTNIVQQSATHWVSDYNLDGQGSFGAMYTNSGTADVTLYPRTNTAVIIRRVVLIAYHPVPTPYTITETWDYTVVNGRYTFTNARF